MKKILVLSAAALLCAGLSLQAKTADELRVYLNPGHGSWGSNDRPMSIHREVNGELTTVNPNTSNTDGHCPDTTAFYETNTNLQKLLSTYHRLEDYGLKTDKTLESSFDNEYQVGYGMNLTNNVFISRTKNGPYPYSTADAEVCNRSLSVMSVEVESNNFDFYLSVHSNAATDGSTANYPLWLYRGTDTCTDNGTGYLTGEETRMTESKSAGSAIWKHLYKLDYYTWSAYSTSENLRGDVNFYGSASVGVNDAYGYLGALKHHVIGGLYEGYFHTYQPARHRALNFDICKVEGLAYARGIADYFGLSKESTGEIVVFARDTNEKFSATYYSPNGASDDVYMPLNGATFTLKKDGNVIETKTADNNYNGSAVFFNLEPGTYTVAVSKEGYNDLAEELELTVKAATTTTGTAWMVDVNYEPPSVIYYDYEDPLAGEASVGPAGEYVYDQTFTNKELTDLAALNVRRMIVKNGNAYVLGLDGDNNPTIQVLDAATGEVTATVSTTGASGAYSPIYDIALTADNVLVAVNADIQAFGGANKVNLYRWENDENGVPTGDPVNFVSMNHAGNWSNAAFGKSMAYAGTLADGKAYVWNKSTGSESCRLEIITVIDGAMSAAWHNNWNSVSGSYTDEKLGDYQCTVSPLNDGCIILTSQNCQPMEIEPSGTSAGVPTVKSTLPEGLIGGTAFRANMFKYAGKVYMAAPNVVAGECQAVALLDITAGLANASVVSTVNTGLPVANATAKPKNWVVADAGTPMAAGATYVTRNSSTDALTGHWMDLYAYTAEGLTRMTTQTVDQPVTRNNFAYDLAMTTENDIYTLTFKSTGEAHNGRVILTNINNDEDVIEVPFGDVIPGENTVPVDAAELTEGEQYNWAIAMESNAIGEAGVYWRRADAYSSSATRGGIVVITDPEQDSFGKVVVAAGYAQGLEVYDPVQNLLGSYHAGASTMDSTNGSSLMRGGQHNGKAVFVDWSDSGAGYWQLDPENPEELTNILDGDWGTGGCYTLDGTPNGGGGSGICFLGTGEDEVCYVWCEDYPTANGNNLIRYNIGGADRFNMYPTQMYRNGTTTSFTGLFANTNCEVTAIEEGVFISQSRSSGNNASGCPCFIFIDHDGNILYNSGSDENMSSLAMSTGLAISPDKSTLAVSKYSSTTVMIYHVDWTDGVPSFTYLYDIAGGSSSAAIPENVQLKFDLAGNLYGFQRGRGYTTYSLINDAPSATTPAKKSLIIKGTSTGIENVATDKVDANGPVEYYNLQGVRVENPAAGSIVIRRQGNTATKILVK
ncbi:MAG: prealbumin-like fold domain-containing protein [Bacteroidales bacterium]|nr:prealbumin-like fold domain-containing protein [Bacteroidales bacterium]